MIQKLLNVSLQKKIIGLVVGILISLIILLFSVFAYFDANQIFANKNRLSLQTAKTISLMPSVKQALQQDNPSKSLQFFNEQHRVHNDIDFIVIQNHQGYIVTHPNKESIGQYQKFDDGYLALVFGGYYNMESDEFIGPSIVGKAPILSDKGNVLGVVTVGFLKKGIYATIAQRLKNIFLFSIWVIVIGIIASYLLARHIRKDTLGLEPREIATLYRDRDSVLSSINEGVIATDEYGKITLINTSAKKLLNLTDDHGNKSIFNLLPNLNLDFNLEQLKAQLNKEVHINDKNIIINLVPIINEGKKVGTVTTFRDKTEITEMLNTLSEVKKYSDDLRSQTHEFSNKMHLISGLLQLKRYDEVLKMVQQEVETIETNNRMIFEQIKDFKVQAVLLGKMSKAFEKKVNFSVDESSSLQELPAHIELSHLITIIGNLLDNAFDELINQSKRSVVFSTLDIGNDIIFEISDNGSGLKSEQIEKIFQAGYTTKSNGNSERGFGLFNVKEIVNSLHGSIEIDSGSDGTTFTVYIPKSLKGDEND
ncbi:ATP-binding protein [Virgibacillus ndiopensis]|uniref:ATP-binding protein n=1 Tax=Virgibacillus ndiopensis TaxID=2004408 RepID=UPI00159BDB45|nr:sensor histidine kinase [Virgibacillus ndiopensis]